jgi:dTDP-4-dehydrorhamnose 3,5-epimerase-like enzyme
MNLEHKKINFEDERGTITDIFVGVPKEHCTIIFTRKGGVRGNHYHAQSRQHDFIVSGSFKAYGQRVGENKVTEVTLQKNDLVTWEPNEAHEFIALEDGVFITFVDGPRGGDDFEKDTFRLATPLHEQFAAS